MCHIGEQSTTITDMAQGTSSSQVCRNHHEEVMCGEAMLKARQRSNTRQKRRHLDVMHWPITL